MSATVLGDALFGFALYIVVAQPDLSHFALFTARVSTATLFVV